MIMNHKRIIRGSSHSLALPLLLALLSSHWMQTANAMESFQTFESMLYAKAFHITICLQDASSSTSQQLPDWLVEKPTIIKSESNDKDKPEEEYYVAMFTEIIFSAGDTELSELCQAYLVENEEEGTGNIAKFLPQAKRIQSSRCVGLPLAGYDDATHTISRELNSEGRAVYRSELNGRFLYAEKPMKGLPIDLASTATIESFDTFHTHHSLFRNETKAEDAPVSAANADNSTNSTNGDRATGATNWTLNEGHPYYGYLMRIDFPHPTDINVYPVQVSLGDIFQEKVNPHLDASKLDFCFSIETSFETPKGGLLSAIYNEDMTPQELYSSLTEDDILKSLNLDESGFHKINLEEEVYDIMKKYVNPFGAAGFELPFMSRFRYATAILDILYIFFAMAQRKMSGQYPSKRFDSFRMVMITHVITGMLVIYIGTFFHIENEIKAVSVGEDRAMYRQILYYIMGAAGIGHTLTVTMALSKVMGERRITIPLYSIAALINITNGIKLVLDPNLQKCFLLWGSMNVFVYVRAVCTILCFAYVDWELVYTFGITMAAFIAIPLSNQDPLWFISLAGIFVYAPFHDTICEKIGWAVEDHMNGNKPTRKNVTSTARKLRTKYIDEDFEKKIQSAKRQSVFGKAMSNMTRFKSFRFSKKATRMSTMAETPETPEKLSAHLEKNGDASMTEGTDHYDHIERLSVPRRTPANDDFYPAQMIDSPEKVEGELEFSLDNCQPNTVTFAGGARLMTVASGDAEEELDDDDDDDDDDRNSGEDDGEVPGGMEEEPGRLGAIVVEQQPKRRVYRQSIRKTITMF
ncbi:unnamed protein product [Cylindrotheca closterium]|uniref:Intimal thickness related receptor IRP domain-containing protein n=1 Tax=Cylindrotheca closterium TaxID=2856 RepID=A0AAD2G856_9STRA|nr:unnamed protein product [Cylindrotheca closterium]